MPAVEHRGSLVTLSGIKVDMTEGLTLTATNWDLAIEADVAADGTEAGAVVVPAALLASFLRTAAGSTVELSVHGSDLRLASDETVVKCRTLPIDQWPKRREVKGQTLELTAATVAAIGRIAYAADKTIDAVGLHGVWFLGHNAVATDKYRLASFDMGTELPKAAVPASTLRQVVKAAPDEASVLLTLDEDNAHIVTPNARWITALAQGRGPEMWERTIPKAEHSCEAQSAELLDSLERIAILGSDRVTLRLDGGKLNLSTVEKDVGEIADAIPADGDMDHDITINVSYLRDAITAAASESVKIETVDARKPAIIRSGAMLQLIMPTKP
jgi:DNA polymerase III sliding clamp (beta) subunit (PCNA family)